jgi:hypothetical protein
MSDWADEKAMELLAFGMDEDDVADVAAALRQARLDALEEAARELESFGAHGGAAAIRALKEKQP